ncbi:MAG: hypothetical protein DRG35_01445 [Deltaproteobacteria bacterium]|nr:MAG: hypothetical protein DRG35_01445 [Deltaproteobacteria bacterium]
MTTKDLPPLMWEIMGFICLLTSLYLMSIFTLRGEEVFIEVVFILCLFNTAILSFIYSKVLKLEEK